MPDIEIKVVNAGKCVSCGQLIKTVDCDSGVANIFLCKECNDKRLQCFLPARRKSNECKTESEEV